MGVILAVLLLAIPMAWLGLRAAPEEEPAPSGTPHVASRPRIGFATAYQAGMVRSRMKKSQP
jgi:hypothetical protein